MSEVPHRMSLHMTFEKIERAPASNEEHPAHKAARMIRQLHLDNIDLINAGHVFMRADAAGGQVDVTEQIKTSCEQQIKLCDEIMERSKNMDPSHWSPSLLLCEDVQKLMGEYHAEREKLQAPHQEGEEQEVLGSILPEIGDYGHKQ